MVSQSEANLSPLQEDEPSTAKQGTKAAHKDKAAVRPDPCDAFQPCLGHGFRAWPVGYQPQDQDTNGGCYLLPLPPVVGARFSYKGEDVVQTLERTCRQVGYPAVIRVDNGSEFISSDLDMWAYHKGVVLDFSRPGKPTDNSFIESFNGKLRAECLNAHWFMNLDDARVKMEGWRKDYNEFRPHSAIGNKVPISLMNGSSAPPPT